MSIERDLISKILTDRDLTEAGENGITPSYFQGREHREAYTFILEHQREYSQVPSVEAFKRNYPTYRISEAVDAFRFYVDELADAYQSYLLEDGLVEATDLFDSGDIEAAKNAIARCLLQVNQQVTKVRVMDLTETGPERIERYRSYSKNGGALKGISTGFHLLDVATSGMQGGQLFTFVGPPKAGKSTMLLLSAMFANMGFYRPLFIGFEMSNDEQAERHDAIRAGISHSKLRDGELHADDFQKVEKMTRRLESMPAMIFTADTASASTLSGIAALVDKYKPDVVYIDGVYMVQDENGEPQGSPQALTNISRGLKRMAQNTNLPFAISTQVLTWKMDRKRGVTTGSIGYSSSFGQDSDVLIGVEPTDDPDINKVKILDGRNVKRMEIYVKWDWETGVFEEMEPEDLNEMSDEDAAATKF